MVRMPLNQEKVLQILKNQVNGVEKRYEKYHSDILELVAEIVALEREHETRRISIVDKIADRIDLKASDLFREEQ